jgi:hypothetical protein
MLAPEIIQAEIATLKGLLDGLGDQKIRVVIGMTTDALEWALEGSESEPPSKMLSLLKLTRPYRLSGRSPV